MATLHERFQMREDAKLRQRVTAAVHDRAFRVLQAGGSTAQQKADALKRLGRVLTDGEWLLLVNLIGAAAVRDPADDAIQTAVDSVYAQLPGP